MAEGKRCVHVLLCLFCAWDLVLGVCELNGEPVACYPPSETNIIANLPPLASNTCGLDGPERVCYLDGAGGTADPCDICDASSPETAHPPSLMTDEEGISTFWQSQNLSVVQFPNTLVITFPIDKTYDISRVAITFQSPRPESYAIFKSTDYGVSFTPWHYYSLSCNDTYGVEEGTTLAAGDEAVALCTSEEASETPLSGGETEFRPLQYRPSADDLVNNVQLQEWMRATHVQLRLDRLHTLGDLVEPDLVASHYYAISDVQISGVCLCSGHAASCSGSAATGDAVCQCEHNTQGSDCEECSDFFQDRPWRPATPDLPSTCAGECVSRCIPCPVI